MKLIGMKIVSCKYVSSETSFILMVTFFVISSVLLTWWYIHTNVFVNKIIIKRKNNSPEQLIEQQMEMFHFLKKQYMHVPKSRRETEINYNADSLPAWDYTRLVNLTRFKFILENTVCYPGESVDVLVGVHSRPQNINRRIAIRNTWGQPMEGLKVLFFIGWVEDPKEQNMLDDEDQKYHDLIQGSFIDSFKNLTYKHIMIFKYVIYYCPSAKYVLKADDDVYVNIEHVRDFLKKNISVGENYKKSLILGALMHGSPIIRCKCKYFVPFEENPHSFYPAYVSGYAIIYSYDVVFRIYREAQRGEYLYIDDAFVSGILAKRINVKHTDIPSNAEMHHEEMREVIMENWTRYNENFWYCVNIEHEDVFLLHAALTRRKIAMLRRLAVSHQSVI